MLKVAKISAEQQAELDRQYAAWKALQKEFVLESERISGEGYDPADPDVHEEFKNKYWESQEVKAHLEIAEILNRPGGRYVTIWHINAALARKPDGFVRTGIQAMSIGRVPEARDIPRCLERLDTMIQNDIETYRYVRAGELEKDAIAWRAHDEVVCAEFFKGYNDRTGRLVYNHVRTLLGLDTHVVRFEKSVEYYHHLQHYKNTVYLPNLLSQRTAKQSAGEAA